MLHIIHAKLINDYNVYVEFNNGKKGMINFRNILENDHRKIIQELLNKDLFKTLKVNLHTLCWANEVDFAPEYLYEQAEFV